MNSMLEHSKYEIESIIEQFVPLKKKWSRKKHLLKETIRKILYKQFIY